MEVELPTLSELGGKTAIEVGATAIAVIITGIVGWAFRRLIIQGTTTVIGIAGTLVGKFATIRSIDLRLFIRDRNDYKKRRKGKIDRSTISSYITCAESELIVVSINFLTAAQFENVENSIVTLLDRGVHVTISLIDPDRFELVQSIAKSIGLSKSELEAHIKEAAARLCKMKRRLSQGSRARLVLRHHLAVPFASAIIIDPDSINGTIQLETKPYGASISQSFGFTLGARGSHPLYRTLIASYRKLVADGVQMRNPR